MPRPTGGYRNKAEEIIPATGDIIKRFKEPGALINWAYNRGRDGLPRNDNSNIDIGTAVHQMAELDLQGRSDDDIEFYLTTTLRDEEELEKARISFKAFRQWRAKFHVEEYVQELSLISEKHQFGGTIDAVVYLRNGIALLDLKTSKDGTVYPDHVWQLAAYSILWEENRPNEILGQGYHLVTLPKDGSKPVHREFSRADIEPFREEFKLLRKAWDFDRHCTSAKALKGIPVQPSIAPERPAKTIRKPQARVEQAPPRYATMGELLRAMHVKEPVHA